MLTGISNSIFLINIMGASGTITALLGLAVGALQIILCIKMLKLKRQALNIYIGVIAARALIQIFGSIPILIMNPTAIITMIWPFILKGLLLAVIYKFDGKHFGGGSNEPISVRRMRERLERENNIQGGNESVSNV
jgi:hypothetical protein